MRAEDVADGAIVFFGLVGFENGEQVGELGVVALDEGEDGGFALGSDRDRRLGGIVFSGAVFFGAILFCASRAAVSEFFSRRVIWWNLA